MKKLFTMLLLYIAILGLAFGATINSKQGYKELSWGSSVEDAKRAGYKLTPMDKEYTNLLYAEPVEAYKVTSKDKSVIALQFHYYKGKLFFITETITGYGLDPKKLANRYGDFNKRGIIRSGKQYTDATFEADGSISNLSITIATNSDGNTITNMYDWNVYKSISSTVQKSSKKTEATPVKKTIIDELEDMAHKLVQEKSGTNKPSFAFSYLTTDYKNVLVENYVTDALTEAMFNTGKIKIIERAYLEEALKEQKFQSSGLVNEETAKSIGMLVGADFICYGTLKDLGDSFTVNARVVDVETGELCAISRATITKDGYLKQRPQKAEGERNTAATSTAKTATPAATTAASTSAKTTPVANNAWKVTTYTDKFAGFTKYIFSINSSDTRKLFVSYQKYENSAYNRVIAGIYWGYDTEYPNIYTSNSGEYDIKGPSETVTKRLRDDWKMQTSSSDKDYFWFAWDSKAGARWLVDIMRKSDSVAVRRDGVSRKFQTAGLLDKMAEYGITWAEIDAAIANEEF